MGIVTTAIEGDRQDVTDVLPDNRSQLQPKQQS